MKSNPKYNLRHKKYRLTHKNQIKAYKKGFVYKFHKVKSSAKTRGHIFTLTKDEYISLVSLPCHYCSEENFIGIDRKDSGIGYIYENCVPCCWPCNNLKRKNNYSSFVDRCKKIGMYMNNK